MKILWLLLLPLLSCREVVTVEIPVDVSSGIRYWVYERNLRVEGDSIVAYKVYYDINGHGYNAGDDIQNLVPVIYVYRNEEFLTRRPSDVVRGFVGDSLLPPDYLSLRMRFTSIPHGQTFQFYVRSTLKWNGTDAIYREFGWEINGVFYKITEGGVYEHAR